VTTRSLKRLDATAEREGSCAGLPLVAYLVALLRTSRHSEKQGPASVAPNVQFAEAVQGVVVSAIKELMSLLSLRSTLFVYTVDLVLPRSLSCNYAISVS
jgi:hypothetical protein